MLGFRTAGFIKSNRPTVTLVSSRNDSPKMTGAVPVLHFRIEIRTRSSLLKNKAVLSLAGSEESVSQILNLSMCKLNLYTLNILHGLHGVVFLISSTVCTNKALFSSSCSLSSKVDRCFLH